MAGPTAQYCAKNVLAAWGITSLDPSDTTTTAVRITTTDLQNVATVLSQAFQTYWSESGSEARGGAGSGCLNAPTSVTLSVTQGSTTISALTTYAAWMIGCTIRISGDAQDNELLTSTKLAKPFNGSTGAKTATIFGDCVVIDDSIEKVNAPLVGQDGIRMLPAFTREDFMRLGQYPMVTDITGSLQAGLPFYFYAQKPISSRPVVWFVDGAFDPLLDYLPRRLRFSPMPSQPYVFGYSAIFSSPRILTTDIWNGTNDTDPGKKLPIADNQIESIYLPICRQIATGYPQFHNSETLPEIGRAFKAALGYIKDIKGQGGIRSTRFQ